MILHDLHLIKRDGKLFPATAEDAEIWKRVPNDETFRVKLKLTRNPKFHRMSWALAERLAQNWPGEHRPTSWEVMRYLKFKTDLVEFARNLDSGKMEAIPASTSFSAMNQADYSIWWGRALSVAASKLGIDVEQLRDELDDTKQWGKCANPDCNNKASEEHHIFMGHARRERSDRLGYVIKLCKVCHLKSHGNDVDELTQDSYKRKWCEIIGVDYEEAKAKINSAEKVYKLKDRA